MKTVTIVLSIIFSIMNVAFSAEPDPIFIAAVNGQIENIKKLINKENVNITDKDLQTPLHHAVANYKKEREKDYLEVIQILKDKGADINAKNKWGDTPLSIATSRKYDKVLQILNQK